MQALQPTITYSLSIQMRSRGCITRCRHCLGGSPRRKNASNLHVVCEQPAFPASAMLVMICGMEPRLSSSPACLGWCSFGGWHSCRSCVCWRSWHGQLSLLHHRRHGSFLVARYSVLEHPLLHTEKFTTPASPGPSSPSMASKALQYDGYRLQASNFNNFCKPRRSRPPWMEQQQCPATATLEQIRRLREELARAPTNRSGILHLV